MKLVQTFLDLLFPPKCIFCRKLLKRGEQAACANCLDGLPETDGAGRFDENYGRCVSCFYYEGQVRDAILRFKFSNAAQYAKPFGAFLAKRVRETLGTQYDYVSWIPVSRRRKRERGYDQAGLLAKELSRQLGIPLQPFLKKVVHTSAQSGIHDPALRRANVLGSYCATDGKRLQGARVLLVDDVITTGATMAEACRTLEMAGAQAIDGVTLSCSRENNSR